MTPTRPIVLAILAAIAAVLGLTISDLADSMWSRSLPVPASSAITVAVVALALLVWAVIFRRRLRDDTKRVDPFTAVRTAALAMAASRAGAIIGGLFLGIGLWYAADLTTPLARERALICAAGLVAAIVLVVAALWLERLCRLPDDDASDSRTGDIDPRDGGDWVHPRV